MGRSITSDETLDRIRFRGSPVADPGSVVRIGRARFTVLAPRLLRLEWSETGQWEDRATYAFPTRHGPAPCHDSRMDGDALVIDTGALELRYRPDDRFQPDNLSIGFELDGKLQRWRPAVPGSLNLRGTRRTLDECAGDAALDEGLLSRAGWALFDDSRSVVFGAEDGWPAPRPEHELQDWYFFGYGHDYQAALAEYAQFGGPIPLIPRYVLGAWWSRYWAYSDQDLKDLVNDFRARELPLDVLVVDMDWHTPHTWTGYTWNRELFPDPPAFLQWVHEQGLRVTLNLHPAQGVQSFEEIYARFAEAMGVDPASGEAIPFRIADERFAKHYLELLHHPLEDGGPGGRGGVDFWWMDWQQGETSEVKGLDPLIWLNHLHFQDSTRRGRRPMLYSRWGGLGNHRYPIGFSGDTYATWTALQFQPFMTATASNVAYGWWSHDIGGHMGGATEPELFARWVQFGALSPCLRLHATKDDRAERRPWKYPPEVYRAAKEAFHLRYRLVPTLYTMARVAHDTGISLCRPMYYEYPKADAAYAARYQYFLGDQMIAAPIVFPADPETGLAATDVWVPEGTWIDFQTRETITGPRWVRLVGDLYRVPILVMAGAILPLAPLSSTTETAPGEPLILSIYPGGDGTFRLYEDDGITEAYKEGQHEWTRIRTRLEDAHTWTVEIEAVEGRCETLPGQRRYEIRLEGSRRPQQVLVDGAEVAGWTHNAESMTTTIHLPLRDKRQPVVVTAVAQDGISALGEAHNRSAILSDVQRLLGAQCPQDAGDVGAILRLDAPGRADAVARLGGPFAQFVEFVTPEEASQQLGRVIIGAPADTRETYDLDLTFRLFRGGEIEQHSIQIQDARAPQILDAPFAYDGQASPTHWEAEARLTWKGQTLTYTHRSGPLFPTIPCWRSVIFDEEQASMALDEVLDGKGNLNEDLDWDFYVQQADPPPASLADAHLVRLDAGHEQDLGAGRALAGYVAAAVSSPEERSAILHFWASFPVDWYLNGHAVVLVPAEEQTTAQPPFFQPTRTSVVLRLRAGENSLVAATRPPAPIQASTGLSFWQLGGALTTPDGTVMTDLLFQ